MDGDDEIASVMIDDDKGSKLNLSSDLLDVDVYAALYSGRTKISRLMFIADRCGNQTMKSDALKMAYDETKNGENTKLFNEVAEKIDGKLGSEYGLDQTWVDTVDRKAELRKEKLENKLNAYRVILFKDTVDRFRNEKLENGINMVNLYKEIDEKIDSDQSRDDSFDCKAPRKEKLESDDAYRTSLIKESIRMGYNDFGDFYYSHGHLGDAFKNYARTRDYCTTSKHILQMCMDVILVSIEMGQFTHVATYVTEAEQTPDALDPVAIAKLQCAAGLAHLESKKYKLAARKFLETGPELENTYREVIAPQDVATYGGLCALASFDRAELKSKVIDNFNFQNLLELAPKVREIVNDFYSSHYTTCLKCLGDLEAVLQMDIHLHDHIQGLYSQIRRNAIIQYVDLFLPVDLRIMATTFRTDVPGLYKELQALITDNQIQARIDSRNQILCAEQNPLQSAAAAALLEVRRCQGLVSKYEKALMAVDNLKVYIELESEVEDTSAQLANLECMLKEKLPYRERSKLEANHSCMLYHLEMLNVKAQALMKKVKNGIRGKTKEDLESLLKDARYELEVASHVRSKMKKEYAAAEGLGSANLSQELGRLASEEVDREENMINLGFRLPDGSRCCHRFLMSDRLQSVISYLDVDREVRPGTYRLVIPYPTRLVFTDSESALALSDLGLAGRREVLMFLESI